MNQLFEQIRCSQNAPPLFCILWHLFKWKTIFHDWKFLKNSVKILSCLILVNPILCIVAPLFMICWHSPCSPSLCCCVSNQKYSTQILKKDFRPKQNSFRVMKSSTKTVTFSAALLAWFACVSSYFVEKVQQVNMAALWTHFTMTKNGQRTLLQPV